jgi:hypothetical protein
MKAVRRLVILQKMGIIYWQFQVSFSYAVVSCFHAFMLKRKKSAGITLQQYSVMQVSSCLICAFTNFFYDIKIKSYVPLSLKILTIPWKCARI